MNTEKNDSGDGERYAWECYEELKAQLAQVTAERDEAHARVCLTAIGCGSCDLCRTSVERDRYRAALASMARCENCDMCAAVVHQALGGAP